MYVSIQEDQANSVKWGRAVLLWELHLGKNGLISVYLTESQLDLLR